MIDNAILALLVIGTLVLFYGIVFKIALQAGKAYPAGVKVPAFTAGVAILVCGIVQGLQLLGFLAITSPAYQVPLLLGLVTAMIAIWRIAVHL